MSGLEIIPFDEAHQPALIELQALHWKQDAARRRAYFDWKYRDNPYTDRPLVWLAIDDGRLVGMRGFWGARFVYGAEHATFDGPCAGDALIAPEYRSRGLLARLNEAGVEGLRALGYAFALNVSSGKIMHLAMRTQGFREIGCLARFRLGPRARTPHPEPFRALEESPARDAGFEIDEAPRPNLMAALNRAPEERIRPLYEPAYFAWRFRNPLSVYRFVYATKDDGALAGYVVLQHPVGETRRWVSVLEWEAEDEETRARLLDFLLEHGRFDELGLWTAYLSEAETTRLSALGFCPHFERGALGRLRPTMLYKALAPEPEVDLRRLEGWRLSKLCSDAY